MSAAPKGKEFEPLPAEFEPLRARLAAAKAAWDAGLTSISKAKGSSGADALLQAQQAYGLLEQALVAAPFSSKLRLRLAEAALLAGAWQDALTALRLAAKSFP